MSVYIRKEPLQPAHVQVPDGIRNVHIRTPFVTNSHSQTFTIAQNAPVGYPISVRVWRSKPPVQSWTLEQTLQNMGSSQSVCRGAGLYSNTLFITGQYPSGTSTNTGLNLVKRDLSGNYIDHRVTTNDNGGTHTQVNGVFYNRNDDLLYVSASNFPNTQNEFIYKYDPSDLSYLGSHQVGSYTTETAVYWQGSWWAGYYDASANFIERYNASWVLQKQYSFPHAVPGSQPINGGINGLTVIGDILYANWHEMQGTYLPQRTGAYVIADDELLDVGRIDFGAEYAGQDLNYHPETGLVYWAEYPGGGTAHGRTAVTTPVYAPEDLYCEGQCKSDFSDLRVVDPANDKVLCGEGTGWMEYVCGPDNEGNSAFCWLHFTLQDAITGPKTLRLEFGNPQATWLDSRSSVVDHINDFEDGTIGDFTGTYNTVTTVESSTEDSLDGTRSLKWVAPGGGVYCPPDTYTDGQRYRLIAWIRRVPGQTANDNYFMDASDGLRSVIRFTEHNASSYDPDAGDWVYLQDHAQTSPDAGDNEWCRFEIRQNKAVPETFSGMWIGKGSGIQGELPDGWFTMQTLSPAYTDVQLYGVGFADKIFRLPLVIPEPVVSAVQSVQTL